MFGIKARIVPVTSRPNYTVHQLSWIGIANQIIIVNILEWNWKSNSGAVKVQLAMTHILRNNLPGKSFIFLFLGKFHYPPCGLV